ncbi:MAG: beta-propeller domain-containing protein [Candidatus Aenigmarchaeota archaeon]|nr:beta-propeller domain-containing protein [Candidatus Aenigmarchaeota archaeon]
MAYSRNRPLDTDASKIILVAIAIISVLILSYFLLTDQFQDELPGQDTNGEKTGITAEGNASQELMKFESVQELREFLSQRVSESNGYRSYSTAEIQDMAESDSAMKSTSSPSAGAAAANGASDYSQTNVQVEGVDEADFVKNDNRYIYLIADNQLVIVDAYDAENAEIVSKTRLEGAQSKESYYDYPRAQEMFVLGDRLALFVTKYEKAYYFERYDVMPRETYKQRTQVYIYDISDRSKPKVINTYSVSGSYYQSRMNGGVVYLVTLDPANYQYLDTPIVRDLKGTTVTPEVYYFDNPDENYQFNTITSIDLQADEVVDSKSFLLGYTNTMMVSENNIYIAYQRHANWCWGWWRCYGSQGRYDSERFYKVVVPLLEGDLKTDINKIISEDISEEEKWTKISQALSDFFVAAQKDEKLQDKYEDMFLDIQKALAEYDTKKALEESRTVIHKIGIDNGKIEYLSEGEVDGSLLNQFSLDEFEGNLRVATTVTVWLDKRIQYNNVYVLDEGMNTIGKLEELAEDERIYSTRFLGDKLYMVTFRQVDPFFVIDLSDPKRPEMLGYLKIPGYSDYLHPYDETHIIGVGKETKENEYGGVSLQGIKIALFDVSDFENPKEVDRVVIGESGSDSAALHDHKAFLFSKTKNLLVLPVTEVVSRDKTGMYEYNYRIWNGAYVFSVSEDGFEEVGKVRHSSSDSRYFNWWNQATVQRGIYMDDNLYTISSRYIKINDLAGDLDELNTIDLPYTDDRSIYYE